MNSKKKKNQNFSRKGHLKVPTTKHKLSTKKKNSPVDQVYQNNPQQIKHIRIILSGSSTSRTIPGGSSMSNTILSKEAEDSSLTLQVSQAKHL